MFLDAQPLLQEALGQVKFIRKTLRQISWQSEAAQKTRAMESIVLRGEIRG